LFHNKPYSTAKRKNSGTTNKVQHRTTISYDAATSSKCMPPPLFYISQGLYGLTFSSVFYGEAVNENTSQI